MTDASSYAGGVLLVLDGDLPSREMIAALHASSSSLLVAADGAALQLKAFGISPDVIIGDLDVVRSHLNNPFFGQTRVVECPDQEDYDGGKALGWIAEEGYDRVTVLGAGGGMIDHVLNNFSLLARYSDRLLIRVCDGGCVGYFVCSELHLPVHVGDRISLLPMPTARLRTEGLEWNLEGEELAIGKRSGASNRAEAQDVRIAVEGCVVVFHYPKIA